MALLDDIRKLTYDRKLSVIRYLSKYYCYTLTEIIIPKLIKLAPDTYRLGIKNYGNKLLLNTYSREELESYIENAVTMKFTSLDLQIWNKFLIVIINNGFFDDIIKYFLSRQTKKKKL